MPRILHLNIHLEKWMCTFEESFSDFEKDKIFHDVVACFGKAMNKQDLCTTHLRIHTVPYVLSNLSPLF
jgi:hypothetical protein